MTTTIQTVGNLGRDPELKFFQSGSCKCTMALAVKQKGEKQQDGTWKDPETWWVEVELWNKAAERIADKFHKGDTIDVRGEAHREIFPRRDGSQGEKLVIKFASVDLVKAKEPKADAMSPASQALTPHAAVIETPAAPPAAPAPPQSSEIPF